MVALIKNDNQIAPPSAQEEEWPEELNLKVTDISKKDKSNEWYTPAKYIEAARDVMGSIDLDPASCELANQTVRAARYYSKEDDGLSKPWYGRVWLNPPYSLTDNKGEGGLFKGYTASFSDKLITEYEQGNVLQAIMLVLAKVDSQWFQSLWNYPICFANHSVKFNGIKKNPKNSLKHMFGTCFAYLGTNEQKFIDVFSQFGTIAKRVSPPRQEIAPIQLWEVR